MPNTKVTKTIEKLSDARVRVEIEIPAEAVNTAFTNTITELARDVKIPGFRKGKIPHPVIERKFADDISKHVLQTLISKELDTLFATNKDDQEAVLNPISEPTLTKNPDLTKGAPLCFSLEYDVIPAFDLPELESINAKAATIAVSDEDIAEALTQLQEQNADIRTKDSGIVAAGDLVTLDYVENDATGNSIEESRKKGFTCVAGSDALGLQDALIGLKKNSPATIPASDEKTTKTVTLTKISERSLPKLDDEFAQDVGEEYETLDDLKDSLKKKQKEQLAELQDSYFVANVFEKLSEYAKSDLPASLTNREFSKLADQYLRKHFPDDYQTALNENKITQEELHTELDELVEKNVKNQLVLSKLIERYTLNVSDEEVANEINTLSGESNPNPDMIEQYKQYGLYERFRNVLLERKLNKIVVTHAKVDTTQAFPSRQAFLNETSKEPTNKLNNR